MKFIQCKSRKQNRVTLVKISDEDYEAVNAHKWYIGSSGYVVRSLPGGGKELLHRAIMQAPSDKKVDHIDGDPLNNQRENLRIASDKQNQGNRRKSEGTSSRFKGVSLQPDGRWRAQIKINGKQTYLGVFSTEVEAAMAYDKQCINTFGVFALINLPAALYINSLYTMDEVDEALNELKPAV